MPDRPSSADHTRYYAQAQAWAEETLGGLERSHAAAWRIALGALFVAALNGWALHALGPVRADVPFLAEGRTPQDLTQAAQPLQAGALEANPTFTEAMVARYVTEREEFRASRLDHDVRAVELLSDPAIRASYIASLQRTSGTSPLVLYLPRSVLEVQIASISLLDAGHALVRFSTLRTDLPGAQPEAQQATLAFMYSHAPMRLVDRFENPLGFMVTSYAKSPA